LEEGGRPVGKLRELRVLVWGEQADPYPGGGLDTLQYETATMLSEKKGKTQAENECGRRYRKIAWLVA